MYEDCLDYDNFPNGETDNFEDCNNLEGYFHIKIENI